MFHANTLKKQVNQDFIEKVYSEIKKFESRGSWVVVVGSHVCSEATRQALHKSLIDNGFSVEETHNSYGVKIFRICW